MPPVSQGDKLRYRKEASYPWAGPRRTRFHQPHSVDPAPPGQALSAVGARSQKGGPMPGCWWHRFDPPELTSLVTMQEGEPAEPRSTEVTRKPRAVASATSKRPKKETKKKR